MNLLVLEAMQTMQDMNAEIPILQSANTPGGRERNDILSKKYQGRICRPV